MRYHLSPTTQQAKNVLFTKVETHSTDIDARTPSSPPSHPTDSGAIPNVNTAPQPTTLVLPSSQSTTISPTSSFQLTLILLVFIILVIYTLHHYLRTHHPLRRPPLPHHKLNPKPSPLSLTPTDPRPSSTDLEAQHRPPAYQNPFDPEFEDWTERWDNGNNEEEEDDLEGGNTRLRARRTVGGGGGEGEESPLGLGRFFGEGGGGRGD